MVDVALRNRGRTVALVVAFVLLFTSVAFVAGVKAADTSVPAVFIASGENYPDGLVSGSAAAVTGGPVLLTRKDSLPMETIAELVRLNPDKIYIAGGTAAVSAAVETQLAAYGTVIRLSGSNRYATAAAISAAIFPATIGGIPGPAGPAGADGAVGPIGPVGPTGADSTVAGPVGPIGPVGPTGADSTVAGPVGPTGADSTIPGPKGEKGDPGIQGPPGTDGTNGTAGQDGADGVSGLSREELPKIFHNVKANDTITVTVSCPAGKKVTGGGGWVSDSHNTVMVNSFPLSQETGWQVLWRVTRTTPRIEGEAYAMCAYVP